MERTLEPEVMDTPEEARAYATMDHGEANAAFVTRLLELDAGGRMLDIGTGPGEIPVLVCERLPTALVVGVDLSQHMLEHARRQLAGRRVGPRVSFRLADAKRLDFPDAAFDTVFSNTILHHIPDPRPFLREAQRVLRPGGTLLLRDLFRPPNAECVAALVSRYAGDGTPEQRELFRASLHAALTPGELRGMADEVGLEHTELVIDSDRHMSLQMRRHAY